MFSIYFYANNLLIRLLVTFLIELWSLTELWPKSLEYIERYIQDRYVSPSNCLFKDLFHFTWPRVTLFHLMGLLMKKKKKRRKKGTQSVWRSRSPNKTRSTCRATKIKFPILHHFHCPCSYRWAGLLKTHSHMFKFNSVCLHASLSNKSPWETWYSMKMWDLCLNH